MRHFILGATLALAAPSAALLLDGALFSAPAQADVKTGVDAWSQGDYVKAVEEWRPLADRGDADAQFNMGQAYKMGRGVPMDAPLAMEWFREAAEQGHLRAQDNYGLLLFQKGSPKEAVPYLRKSADRGEPRAQYILGTAYFNGEFVGKDWVQAYALMTRAAQSGLSQATVSLQQMENYIPADQKKKGLALAADLKGKNAATLAAATEADNAPLAREMPKSEKKVVPREPVKQVAAVEAPKAKPAPEKPKPAPEKPTIAPASGIWRVQLGAFSEENRAAALWSSLLKKIGGLSAYRPFYVKGGAVTRLQVGPLGTAADAEKLCKSIKAAGTDCIPKKA